MRGQKVLLRNVKPGQVFILCRTDEKYMFIRRDPRTPSGVTYIVYNFDDDRLTKLHWSSHVNILECP